MRKIIVCQVNSSDGDIHYVFEEDATLKCSKQLKNFASVIKERSKKEASKPLFIARKY